MFVVCGIKSKSFVHWDCNFSPIKLYGVRGRIPRQKVDMVVGLSVFWEIDLKRIKFMTMNWLMGQLSIKYFFGKNLSTQILNFTIIIIIIIIIMSPRTRAKTTVVWSHSLFMFLYYFWLVDMFQVMQNNLFIRIIKRN